MAKYLSPPKKLQLCTKEDFEDFIEVSNQKFKLSIFGEGKNADLNETCISPDGKYYWPSNGDFSNYILSLTDTNDVRSASNVLYQNVTQAPEFSEWTSTPTPEKAVESNTLSPEQLAQFAKEAETRETSQKESQIHAEQTVEAAIKRKGEIYEALKDKKVIVRPVDGFQTVDLTEDDKKKLYDHGRCAMKDARITKETIEKSIIEAIERGGNPGIRDNVTRQEISNVATDYTNKVTQYGWFSSSEEIPTKIPVAIDEGSLLAKLVDPNNPQLIKSFPKAEIREVIARDAQIASLANEAVLNTNTSLLSPIVGSDNIIRLFYGSPEVVHYEMVTSENDQEEKQEGVEIKLDELHDYASKISDYWRNISSPSGVSVEAVETSTSLYPTYTAVTTEVGAEISSSLASTLVAGGAITGFTYGTLQSLWITQGYPLLTGPFLLGAEGGMSLGASAAMTNVLVINPIFNFSIGNFSLAAVGGSTQTWGLFAVQASFGEKAISLLAVQSGSKVTIGLATSAIGEAGGTAATTAITTTGGAAAGTGAGVVIGQITVPIPIIGAVIGAVVGWVASKIDWEKVKNWSAAIIGGVSALIALPFVGLGAALGIGTATTLISTAAGAGLGGATLGGIAGGIGGFFGATGSAFIGSIAAPVLITLLGFPIAVALILFIINSGAYVVPPTSGAITSSNPYIDIQKTASPAGPFQNSDLPLTVDYTITITAKSSPLSNVQLSYKCDVLKKGTKPNCPDIGNSIPGSDKIGTISPSMSYVFDYKMTYSGSSFNDSFVIDTITAVADTPSVKGVTTSGSASIMIGKPDVGCYKTVSTGQYAVPPGYLATYESSITKIESDWPAYMAKVCNPSMWGDVMIGYGGSDPYYWGWHLHTTAVDFILYQAPLIIYNKDVSTEFTMLHESGHHIEEVNAAYYSEYLDYPGIVICLCTYPATCGKDGAYESFAETMGLYGSGRPLGESLSCAGETKTFKEKYPINWKFADTVMFH